MPVIGPGRQVGHPVEPRQRHTRPAYGITASLSREPSAPLTAPASVIRREQETIRRKIAFRKRLRSLGFDSYTAYLESEHWNDVRGRYLRSGLWKGRCHGCRKLMAFPEIHHRTYARLGRERLHDLRGVCHDCHQAIHAAENGPTSPSLRTATAKTLKRRRR